MLKGILVIAVVLEAVLLLKWKISATALIYYMETKKYMQPSKIEIELYTKMVIEKMIKDLVSLK